MTFLAFFMPMLDEKNMIYLYPYIDNFKAWFLKIKIDISNVYFLIFRKSVLILYGLKDDSYRFLL